MGGRDVYIQVILCIHNLLLCIFAYVCTCLTLSSGPSGVPQDVMVMKNENSIRVTWGAPPKNERNGPLTGYIVSIYVHACVYKCTCT